MSAGATNSAASQWAAARPDFRGLVTVRVRTERRGGGGSRERCYTYAAESGRAAKLRGNYRTARFNGVCDVTGRVHLSLALSWYALPHPQQGQPVPDSHSGAVYRWGVFRTSADVAQHLGAIPAPAHRLGDCQHPDYNARAQAAEEVIGL